MANLIIDIPDDMVRSLQRMATAQHQTVEQFAVERLRSLMETTVEPMAGSAVALLKVMRQPPHPTASDVAELEAAIANARIPIQARDPFSE